MAAEVVCHGLEFRICQCGVLRLGPRPEGLNGLRAHLLLPHSYTAPVRRAGQQGSIEISVAHVAFLCVLHTKVTQTPEIRKKRRRFFVAATRGKIFSARGSKFSTRKISSAPRKSKNPFASFVFPLGLRYSDRRSKIGCASGKTNFPSLLLFFRSVCAIFVA